MQRTHDPRRPSQLQQNGFTLMELMFVVLIIGILVAVAIPQYTDYMTRARLSKVNASVYVIKQAIAEYAQYNAGDMSALQASPAGWTAPINSGGLGLGGVPLSNDEIASFTLSAGSGQLDIALQGALASPAACGNNANIRLQPSRVGSGHLVLSWTLSMSGASTVCVNEITKWQ